MQDEEKSLERLYMLGLSYEKAGNFERAAQIYREALLIDPEDHGGLVIRLAAMGKGDTPEGASLAYVTTLFNQHAEMFDYILVDQLDYAVPEKLRKAILDLLANKSEKKEGFCFSRLLDLGCGTGLAAAAFDDLALHKTGVDMAENMVEIAYEKGDYDQVFVGEACQFLEKNHDTWDLILSTDVLPYMGALDKFFNLIVQRLAPDGFFGFSSEIGPDAHFAHPTYKVGPQQRFAHSEAYIRECLEKHKLRCLRVENTTIRLEEGGAVLGQLFISQKNLN
ncbi:methyltransferase domain-containing protein [Bartonella sp. DGB2]|uniref:methyltransferase domain-containing protein n=1 Tax=Bartonella sp. DGB2 TaxID=3388426 RepID=UPI0039902E31